MLRISSSPLGESSDFIRAAAATGGEERVRHGAVRPVADVLHLPGPLPEPEAAAMPALLLHGTVHGGARGLRKETSKAARWLKPWLKPMQHFLLRLRGHPRPCIMHPESALRKWRVIEVYSKIFHTDLHDNLKS